MFKRILVLLACVLPYVATAAPTGFPEQLELTSLNVRLTWTDDGENGGGYEGTYQAGDLFFTLFFEVRDDGLHLLWVTGEDAWENTLFFRYFGSGDATDGFYLYEDEEGYPFSDVIEPFSESDFLEPINGND